MTLTSLYQAKKWGIRDLERRIDMGDIKKEELCNNYDDISDFEDFFTNEALKLETKHENLNKKNRMEERLIKDGIELEIEELFGAEIITEELVNYVYKNINEYLLLDSREEVAEFIKDFLVEVDNIRVIW